jgi:hypothetical protein
MRRIDCVYCRAVKKFNFFSIFALEDMYGAGSIAAGDHKFLPFLKSSPNQLIFVLRVFRHGELESE